MVFAFEGVEKSIEVTFKVSKSYPQGARCISREQWNTLLDYAACTIIGQSSTESFDSYVLSESSLFVYADQVIAKTCGTTKLLNMLPHLLEVAREFHMESSLVVYRRKNFGFPAQQIFPHTDFVHEEAFLNETFHGSSFVFDAPGGDSWFMYVADQTRRGCNALPQFDPASCLHAAPCGHAVLELMMHDLDPDTMARFHRLPEYSTDRDMSDATGITELLANAHVDEHMFTPCGYSCNALSGDRYWTIHVTPELHCSYVSFETNSVPADWPALVRSVCAVFRPSRCVVTLRAAVDTLCDEVVYALDTMHEPSVAREAVYHRRFQESAVAVWFFRPAPASVSTDDEYAMTSSLCGEDLGSDESVPVPVAGTDIIKRGRTGRRKRNRRRSIRNSSTRLPASPMQMAC